MFKKPLFCVPTACTQKKKKKKKMLEVKVTPLEKYPEITSYQFQN